MRFGQIFLIALSAFALGWFIQGSFKGVEIVKIKEELSICKSDVRFYKDFYDYTRKIGKK